MSTQLTETYRTSPGPFKLEVEVTANYSPDQGLELGYSTAVLMNGIRADASVLTTRRFDVLDAKLRRSIKRAKEEFSKGTGYGGRTRRGLKASISRVVAEARKSTVRMVGKMNQEYPGANLNAFDILGIRTPLISRTRVRSLELASLELLAEGYTGSL